MPKLKADHIDNTPAEDAAITAAAMADPDAMPFTDAEWEAAKPRLKIGRPKLERPKVYTPIRFDADIVDAFKSTGKGWQTRMNAALRQFLDEHPIQKA
ncbi:hypothetical protein GALL_329820 [mine drainage metagenome]|jgi:uncharacterized protein (DUF4415 family)|uniref:BrnA antitoxin of type II toxin-antitoxin system n=1 Tax=mine drainage metagenome TaxID=410659 RepID=A0A1J5QNQ2_9ZZZZ